MTEVVEDDAGFDEGFDSVGEQTETPAGKTESSATEAAAPAEPTPPPAPKYVQITEDEWQDVKRRALEVDNIRQESARNFDKAFGQYGSLKQATEALAKRGPLQIEVEDFAELKAEYGEEIATHLVEGLKRSFGRAPQPVQEQPQQARPAVEEALARAQAQLVDSRLDEVVDGDWRQEVRTPEFQQWMKQQPADVQQLGASDSVRDASRMLRLWVKAKSAPAPASAPAAPQQQAQPKTTPRQKAIAAAVNPRGGGARASASNEPDPFDEGFNS